MTDPTEGWGMRGLKLKSHYYRGGETICGQGRHSMGARLFVEPDPWPCKLCSHILATEAAASDGDDVCTCTGQYGDGIGRCLKHGKS